MNVTHALFDQSCPKFYRTTSTKAVSLEAQSETSQSATRYNLTINSLGKFKQFGLMCAMLQTFSS